MATWTGTPKKFDVEFVHKDPNHWDPGRGEVEFGWTYYTASDSLTIKASHLMMKNGSHEEIYGPDWAKAHMYVLADWLATYGSVHELKELLGPILNKE